MTLQNMESHEHATMLQLFTFLLFLDTGRNRVSYNTHTILVDYNV